MTLQNRTVLLISLFIIQIFGLNVANAQYPDRPIRIIVPFAPGGGVDALARPFAKELSEILKQNVIVENKPSASGQIGNTEVARAKPDGYTLLFTSAAYAIAPAFNPKLPYDTLKDLDPISILASNPLVLVASNNFNLDIKNPSKKEELQEFSSAQLIKMLEDSFDDTKKILAEIKKEF